VTIEHGKCSSHHLIAPQCFYLRCRRPRHRSVCEHELAVLTDRHGQQVLGTPMREKLCVDLT
jgi:hypothetical protein